MRSVPESRSCPARVRIQRSSLTAATGFVHGSPNETSTISRSRIKAQVGATTDGGFIDIDNTLILLDNKPGATGLNFHNGNEPVNLLEMGGSIDHVTIVNGVDNTVDDSTGIAAIADTATETVTVNISNSVIAGFTGTQSAPFAGRTIQLQVTNGGHALVDAKYSAFDYWQSLIEFDAPNYEYTLDDHHLNIQDGPKFVDADNGNYTPAADSPLVDAGDPAEPAPGATDLFGNHRSCHGTDAGFIRRDIGAIERLVNPADDCSYPDTTISAKPDANSPSTDAHFEFTSTKSPGTFLCTLDGDTETVCPSPFNLSNLDAGGHTITVRARDQYGNIDQTQESYFWDIHPQEPTCETDPSLCPTVDKTAPKILGLKFPKKTRASKVKVRFRSNESGVTFTCSLNKAKAKKCKSPWSTPRLKKGKNVIRIQATDKAGNKSRVVKRNIKRIVRRK